MKVLIIFIKGEIKTQSEKLMPITRKLRKRASNQNNDYNTDLNSNNSVKTNNFGTNYNGNNEYGNNNYGNNKNDNNIENISFLPIISSQNEIKRKNGSKDNKIK